MDPESFVSGGPNLTVFFCFVLVDEGREDPSTTISGPSSAIGPPAKRHYMAFRWRADDGPALNAGLAAL